MDAIEALKSRRSVRAYLDKPVAREILVDIVDCARLAPCAMNQQLWEFVVVTNRAMVARLGKLIPQDTFLATVPAFIAIFCKSNRFYIEDGAAAAMSILLAARAHGLGSCWIGGDKQPYADEVRRSLVAPADCKLVALVALGYAAEEPMKEKRPLDSMLHWEQF